MELRTQEIKRLHKVLATANRKLGAVASTTRVGVSGRRMLRAVTAGEADPAVLAELATGRLREQLPALRMALAGRVPAPQRQLLSDLLDHREYLERSIQRLEGQLADLVAEQEHAVPLLLTRPVTGPVPAAALLAEIGTQTCPGCLVRPLWPRGRVSVLATDGARAHN